MPKFWTKNALFGYFWPKMSYLGIFGLDFWKYYCHIWNQHPQIYLIAKFCEKTNIPKFGTKNALFGYFWARIWKNYCHIWNQHPRIFLNTKFCKKKEKCLNSRPKMPYLSTFGPEFEKDIVISEIRTLEFLKNVSLFNSYS